MNEEHETGHGSMLMFQQMKSMVLLRAEFIKKRRRLQELASCGFSFTFIALSPHHVAFKLK